jgi:hypothetical protein
MFKRNFGFRKEGQQQNEQLCNNPEDSNWNVRRKCKRMRQIPLLNRDIRHMSREPKEKKR